MRMDTLIVGLVCLVAGFLGGYFFDVSTAPEPGTGQTSQVQQQDNSNVKLQGEIAQLERVVAQDPANREAWVALGHTYFDSKEHLKAIDAYDRALALKGNDPDVLVDQGTMYRRMGWFDKAIANYDKALGLNPEHKNALFNKGVVYRYDLEDFEGAVAAWELFLQKNPNYPDAANMRKQIEFMKAHPPTK